MAKKHQFHCQKCSAECVIYKKGKGHRVLVCPNCGVIATNPLNLRGLLSAGVSSIPFVGGLASYAVDNIGGKKAQTGVTPSVNIQKENKLTAFEKALMLERLERKHGHG